eukprot:1160994-Pelagomonas_calceolata.AAC.5
MHANVDVGKLLVKLLQASDLQRGGIGERMAKVPSMSQVEYVESNWITAKGKREGESGMVFSSLKKQMKRATNSCSQRSTHVKQHAHS